jgi:hypothetical protein
MGPSILFFRVTTPVWYDDSRRRTDRQGDHLAPGPAAVPSHGHNEGIIQQNLNGKVAFGLQAGRCGRPPASRRRACKGLDRPASDPRPEQTADPFIPYRRRHQELGSEG